MFNLIMMGDKDFWQKVTPKRVPLSRFLEYTNDSLTERLTPVQSKTLDFVQGLPCIFTSELDRFGGSNEVNDGSVYLGYGRVENVRVDRGDLVFDCIFDGVMLDIDVTSRGEFEDALGLIGWEFTRSHWAIKDLNIEKTLKIVYPTAGNIEADPETPLPVHTDDAVRVESLSQYIDEIVRLSNGSEAEYFYRGHYNHKYKLEPSLFRRNKNGSYLYLFKEQMIVKEILAAHPSEFGQDSLMIDKLVRMQHYGIPTRLLDVTSNPLVALYFAVSEYQKDKAAQDQDIAGEVIIMKPSNNQIKFFDSDTVGCIANLARLSAGQIDSIDTRSTVDEFRESPSGKELLQCLKSEKPYFDARIVPQDLSKTIFVRPRKANVRVSSQSGSFLMFGKDAILPETGHSDIEVQRIQILNKIGMLRELEKMNVKASTIFPSMEKSAEEIASKYKQSE